MKRAILLLLAISSFGVDAAIYRPSADTLAHKKRPEPVKKVVKKECRPCPTDTIFALRHPVLPGSCNS